MYIKSCLPAFSMILDEEDRRAVFMKLTDEGAKVLKSIDEKRSKILEKAFSNLSNEEIGSFFNVIEKVTRNILNSDVIEN